MLPDSWITPGWLLVWASGREAVLVAVDLRIDRGGQIDLQLLVEEHEKDSDVSDLDGQPLGQICVADNLIVAGPAVFGKQFTDLGCRGPKALSPRYWGCSIGLAASNSANCRLGLRRLWPWKTDVRTAG
jgi:hypothetical protein